MSLHWKKWKVLCWCDKDEARSRNQSRESCQRKLRRYCGKQEREEEELGQSVITVGKYVDAFISEQSNGVTEKKVVNWRAKGCPGVVKP